ncbi:MAG: YihY/virulence factor BrkB family protein [Actinomycetota bacterium]|nr:YihY/virulence factor BrkB family protein [Actinomycetota bacterium]
MSVSSKQAPAGRPGPLARRPRFVAARRWAQDTLPGQAWQRGNEINLGTQSLVLAAQQMLCTAPLLVALSALSRRAGGHELGGLLSRYLGLSPAATHDVSALFGKSARVSVVDLVIGLILAVLFTAGVAAAQQRGFELIWGHTIAGLTARLRQLAWVGGLLVYLFVVFYAGRAGHRVGRRMHAGRPGGPAVQLIVSFLFFWWSQHLLLGGRVPWRRLLPGAAFMAIGMSLLVSFSGLVMSGQIVQQVDDYGLIGATFVLAVWLVVLSELLLGGALLGAVFSERRHSRRAELT